MPQKPKPYDASERAQMDATARGLLALVGAAISITDRIERLPVDPLLMQNAPVAVIVSIWLSGPMRPTRLSKVIGMTSGGTTKVIERLEAAGLVHKSKDPGATDGRAVEVDLTEFGRAVADQLLVELSMIMNTLTDQLNTIRSENSA